MKKLVLFAILVALVLPLFGFFWNSPKKYTVDDFETLLHSLASDPTHVVSSEIGNSRVKNWEDAITNIYCYVNKDGNVSQSLADDSWIYLNKYIQSLESQFVTLEEMYDYVY